MRKMLALFRTSQFSVRFSEKSEIMSRPNGLDQYIEWASKEINCLFNDPRIERLYETNINNIFNAVSRHPFFVGFSNKAKEWEYQYIESTKSELFMDRNNPELITKPFTSVVEKTFRQNVLWNKAFPNQPKGGWYNHQNIFHRINDLVRGSLVCRFIDGPAFVAKAIESYAKEFGLNPRHYSQERDDGYYAFHVYATFPVSVFDIDWNEAQIEAKVEIQVTTQLQEVLRSLTHKFYEKQRIAATGDRGKWKWDFSSSRFKVGYLSHTLHLLESIIVESRDKVLSGAPLQEEEK